MSYPPNDPYAQGPSDEPGQQPNPYAAPSGSSPYGAPAPGQPPQYGAQAPGQPPQYGQPSPYGQSPADPYGQPPQYGQTPADPYGYGAPSGYNQYTPPPGNDGMAIAALCCGIGGLLCGIAGIVGLILGIISLGRINRTGAGGRGMAITGIVLGGIAIAWFVISLATGFGNFYFDSY